MGRVAYLGIAEGSKKRTVTRISGRGLGADGTWKDFCLRYGRICKGGCKRGLWPSVPFCFEAREGKEGD